MAVYVNKSALSADSPQHQVKYNDLETSGKSNWDSNPSRRQRFDCGLGIIGPKAQPFTQQRRAPGVAGSALENRDTQ
jgi:hypothetical protein